MKNPETSQLGNSLSLLRYTRSLPNIRNIRSPLNDLPSTPLKKRPCLVSYGKNILRNKFKKRQVLPIDEQGRVFVGGQNSKCLQFTIKRHAMAKPENVAFVDLWQSTSTLGDRPVIFGTSFLVRSRENDCPGGNTNDNKFYDKKMVT